MVQTPNQTFGEHSQVANFLTLHRNNFWRKHHSCLWPVTAILWWIWKEGGQPPSLQLHQWHVQQVAEHQGWMSRKSNCVSGSCVCILLQRKFVSWIGCPVCILCYANDWWIWLDNQVCLSIIYCHINLRITKASYNWTWHLRTCFAFLHKNCTLLCVTLILIFKCCVFENAFQSCQICHVNFFKCYGNQPSYRT